MPNVLNANLRTEFGKGAARRLRRDKQIPAVLYGHGSDPVHLSLPSHEVFLIVKGSANAVIEVTFDGRTELALVKSIQKDVVTNNFEHFDLLLVRRGEKVSVDIRIVTEGESVSGTIHAIELQSLSVLAEATTIPEEIVVSVEGLEDGAIVRVSDLVLPAGVTTEVDGEEPVVIISTPRGEDEDADTAETTESTEA